MQARLSEISKSLDGELDCLHELVSLAEQERDILLGGRHQELMATSERKLGAALRLQKAQEERRELLESLELAGRRFARMGELTPLLPPEQRESFRVNLRQADQLAQRVTALNQNNKRFVEEALDTVNHLVNILSGGGQRTGYNAQGAPASSNRPRFLAREV